MNEPIKISDTYADWIEVDFSEFESIVYVDGFQDQNDGNLATESDFAFTPEAARALAAALIAAADSAEANS